MNTTAMPDHWAALRCWALRAGFAGAAAFAGTFLALFVFVFALVGPERLQSPVFVGLAGPSVASALMRPGLVIVGTMAVVAVMIYGRGGLRGGNHSATASIVVTDGPLNFRGLRDWPNVRFDDHGAAAAGRERAYAATELDDGGEVDPYDVVHIVGWWQDVMGGVLRLKAPRALCGESLEEDPDRPGPSENSPQCRHCAQRHGSGTVKPVGSYHGLVEGSRRDDKQQ